MITRDAVCDPFARLSLICEPVPGGPEGVIRFTEDIPASSSNRARAAE